MAPLAWLAVEKLSLENVAERGVEKAVEPSDRIELLHIDTAIRQAFPLNWGSRSRWMLTPGHPAKWGASEGPNPHAVAVAEKKFLHFLDRVGWVSHVNSPEKVALPETPALPLLLWSDKSSQTLGMSANIGLLLDRYFSSGRYELTLSASI